jgi:hypothetical protein
LELRINGKNPVSQLYTGNQMFLYGAVGNRGRYRYALRKWCYEIGSLPKIRITFSSVLDTL